MPTPAPLRGVRLDGTDRRSPLTGFACIIMRWTWDLPQLLSAMERCVRFRGGRRLDARPGTFRTREVGCTAALDPTSLAAPAQMLGSISPPEVPKDWSRRRDGPTSTRHLWGLPFVQRLHLRTLPVPANQRDAIAGAARCAAHGTGWSDWRTPWQNCTDRPMLALIDNLAFCLQSPAHG